MRRPDGVREEAEAAALPPVLSATTLQNCAIQFGRDSIVRSASVSDAVRLESLCGADVARSGQAVRFLRPTALRFYFDRAYGMCARRCL